MVLKQLAILSRIAVDRILSCGCSCEAMGVGHGRAKAQEHGRR